MPITDLEGAMHAALARAGVIGPAPADTPAREPLPAQDPRDPAQRAEQAQEPAQAQEQEKAGEPGNYREQIPGWTPEVEARARQELAGLGLSDEHAGAVLDMYARQVAGAVAARRVETESALKKEWGREYDGNMSVARMTAFGLGEEFCRMLDETGAGDDPRLIRALYKLGLERRARAEAGERASAATGKATTREQALAHIDKVRRNPKHPYNRPEDPRHAQAVEELAALYRVAYEE